MPITSLSPTPNMAAQPAELDLPPADAPRPPLTDYIDLSVAAMQHLDGVPAEAPPAPPPPLSYRSMVRMKAPPVASAPQPSEPSLPAAPPEQAEDAWPPDV